MSSVISHLINDGCDSSIRTINCINSVNSSLGSPTSSNQFSYFVPNNLSSVIAVFVFSPLMVRKVLCCFPAIKAKLILVPQQVQVSWIWCESSTTYYWSLSSIVYCSGPLDGLHCDSSEVCIHHAKLLGRMLLEVLKIILKCCKVMVHS
jgi:hypothetical protein